MKKETTKQNTTESQIRCSIKDTFAGTRVKLNQMNLKVTATNGDFNIFLNQNLGKGPPGSPDSYREHSPVAARGHPPAVEERPPENKAAPIGSNSSNYNKVQLIYKKSKFNLLQTFNLLIMKKQILILMVALFAVTTVFGQINPDPNVSLAPTCGGTATNPSVGVSYAYTVAFTATPGYTGIGTYTWKVTDTATDLLAASSVAGTVYTATPAGATNNIIWNASAVGNTYYVVVSYSEPNTSGGGCTINNVRAFEVKPMNGFWLKIAASSDGTVGGIIATYNVCSPAVSSAVVTAGSPSTVKYEFGLTKLFASIHAAGYTGTFQATLTVAGLKASTTVGQTMAVPSGWTAVSVDAAGNGTYSQDLAVLDAGSNYPVELDITNNQYEGLADRPVTITINGTYAGGTQNDKYDKSAAPATTCTDQPDDADYVIQTIKARPTIAPTAPAQVLPTPALN